MLPSDEAMIEDASDDELRQLCRLAIGRLFRMGSRPTQPGDDRKYAEVRYWLIGASEELRRRKQAAA